MPVQLGREGSQEMLREYQSKKLVMVFLPRSNPQKNPVTPRKPTLQHNFEASGVWNSMWFGSSLYKGLKSGDKSPACC